MNSTLYTATFFVVSATLPSFAMLAMGASSFTLGFLASACFFVFIYLIRRGKIKITQIGRGFNVLSITFVLLFLHYILAQMLWGFKGDWLRALLSFAFVVVGYIFLKLIQSNLCCISDSKLNKSIILSYLFFVAVAVLSLAGFPAIGVALHHFPMILFFEPSQYALAFLPFAIYILLKSTKYWLINFIALTALAFTIQSLTLFVGVFVALIPRLNFYKLFAIFTFAMAIFYFTDIDMSYFSSRVDIASNLESDSPNLSVLAYFQGWERAWINLKSTNLIGVGFQQFGIIGDKGEFQAIIANVYGADDLNMYDGGSNGAKIVGEFGIFGVAFLFFYVSVLVRCFYIYRGGEKLTNSHLFIISILIGSFVEIFVRGGGYFTFGNSLLLYAMFERRKYLN